VSEYIRGGDGLHTRVDSIAPFISGSGTGGAQHGDGSTIRAVSGGIGQAEECDAGFAQGGGQIAQFAADMNDRGFAGRLGGPSRRPSSRRPRGSTSWTS